MKHEILEVTVEGFSGPLDLLCHLVESRQLQASKIKMAQLVRIYGAYLSKTRNASVEAIAEFFFMVASLLLQKVTSLLPSYENNDAFVDDEPAQDDEISEEELLARIERFKPYRAATSWLQDHKISQDRHFRRLNKVSDDDPIFDICELYTLCRMWWDIQERILKGTDSKEENIEFDDDDWSGVPESIPDEERIQNRIEEITEQLQNSQELMLNDILTVRTTSQLVVTLLALLEMCRMSKVSVWQEEPFGDVRIIKITVSNSIKD